MQGADCLIVWIEDHGAAGAEAAFLYAAAPKRAPARRRFLSIDCARRWVQSEADEMALPVQWVDARPDYTRIPAGPTKRRPVR
jgi:hypothetical protein